MSGTIKIDYKLIYRFQNPLKYVLSYKTSQDHLELFFSCIRVRVWNKNNPNLEQFKKKTLEHQSNHNYSGNIHFYSFVQS